MYIIWYIYIYVWYIYLLFYIYCIYIICIYIWLFTRVDRFINHPATWLWGGVPLEARKGGGPFYLVDSPGTAEYTMVTGHKNRRIRPKFLSLDEFC